MAVMAMMTAAMTAVVTAAVTATPVAASERRFADHGAERQKRDKSNGGFHCTKRPGAHRSFTISAEEAVVGNRQREAALRPQAQLELTT